jgi:hypothetical protein
MQEATAKELALQYSEVAREIYATEGSLQTVVMLLDVHGLGPLLHPGDIVSKHPAEASAPIIAILGALMPEARFIVFVIEAWAKHYNPEAAEHAEAVQRGDLEKMHERGDKTVTTTVHVSVWDLENLDDSFCVSSLVKNEGESNPKFDISELPGKPEGYVNDVMMHAWEHRLQGTPPEEARLEDAVQLCVRMGLAVGGGMFVDPSTTPL